MEVDRSSVLTLDPAAVKSVTLLAWNKRWSPEKWSICLKPYLTLTEGDGAVIAEVVLDQATFGSTPNAQLLSYVQYAVNTNEVVRLINDVGHKLPETNYNKLVSVPAAITQMTKFTDITRIFCVEALISTVCGFINCICWTDDSISLVKSLSLLTRWLLDVIHSVVVKLPEIKSVHVDVNQSVLKSACNLINRMCECDIMKALLHIGLNDGIESLKQIEQKVFDIRESITAPSADIPHDLTDKILSTLQLVLRLKELGVRGEALLSSAGQQLNLSVNVILSIDAVLSPTNHVQPLVEQLLVLERTQGLSRAKLYCELFRVCLLGSIDSQQKPDELRWAAFTYLKLPVIIKQLMSQGADAADKPHEQLEEGLNQLLHYVSLLDTADTKLSCECLNFLLHELCNKYPLLTDVQCKKILTKRQSMSLKGRLAEPTSTTTHQPGLILRAEPTVLSILKTLDTDHTKNQEALLGILGQMMSGKSFELILSAAAATGKLQCFAAKLIKFNEFSKSSTGENGKNSQIRALLFDISFLMLCHIAQQYGTEVIVSIPESSGTFFVQWLQLSFPEDGLFKSVEMFSAAEQSKVEMILNQINPGGEIKTNLAYWNDICKNIPYAIQEILWAWESGCIQPDYVKGALDVLRGMMCCLPVVVSAWLCSVMSICNSTVRDKASFMLKHLLSSNSKPSQLSSTDPPQYFIERSTLMQVVMCKMVHDLLPPDAIPRPSSLTNMLPPTTPTHHVLIDTFRKTFRTGFLSYDDIFKMDYLLTIGGAEWFCEHLVREVLTFSLKEDLNKGIQLVYSLFHMDLENLALSLIHHTIPSLIQAFGSSLRNLSDPRGTALAKLCVMTLSVVHKMRQQNTSNKKTENFCRKRKRQRPDVQLELLDEDLDEERQAKRKRMGESGEDKSESMMIGNDSFGLTDFLSCTTKETNEETSQTFDSKDSLSRSLVDLFRLFSAVLSDKNVNARTRFVQVFFRETVKLESSAARFILQFMPYNLINQLIRVMSGDMSTEFLLSLCDLQSSAGKRMAARAICLHARHLQIEQSGVIQKKMSAG